MPPVGKLCGQRNDPWKCIGALGRVLRNNNTLKTLTIMFSGLEPIVDGNELPINSFPEEGMGRIAKTLGLSTIKKVIFVGRFVWGTCAMEAMSRTIKENTFLESLTLESAHKIPERFREEISFYCDLNDRFKRRNLLLNQKLARSDWVDALALATENSCENEVGKLFYLLSLNPALISQAVKIPFFHHDPSTSIGSDAAVNTNSHKRKRPYHSANYNSHNVQETNE